MPNSWSSQSSLKRFHLASLCAVVILCGCERTPETQKPASSFALAGDTLYWPRSFLSSDSIIDITPVNTAWPDSITPDTSVAIGRFVLNVRRTSCRQEESSGDRATFSVALTDRPPLLVADTVCAQTEHGFGFEQPRVIIHKPVTCGAKTFLGATIWHWYGGNHAAWTSDFYLFSFPIAGTAHQPTLEGSVPLNSYEWSLTGPGEIARAVFLTRECEARTVAIEAEGRVDEVRSVLAGDEKWELMNAADDSCDITHRNMPEDTYSGFTASQVTSFLKGDSSLLGKRDFWKISSCPGWIASDAFPSPNEACDDFILLIPEGDADEGASSFAREPVALTAKCVWKRARPGRS